MKKQILLTKEGKNYLATIAIDGLTGNIISQELSELSKQDKESKSFSVLLDNETKVRFSAWLTETEGGIGFDCVPVSESGQWFEKYIGKSKKAANLLQEIIEDCDANYAELQTAFSNKASTMLQAAGGDLDNSVYKAFCCAEMNSIASSSHKYEVKQFLLLQDYLTKTNTKNGTAYTLDDIMLDENLA